MKYSTMINGYDVLNLTKLDVLDGLEEVKVGVGYVDAEGKELESFPGEPYFSVFARPSPLLLLCSSSHS
jgi:adenylosuccinate synthase